MSSYYTTITISDHEWDEIQHKVCETNVYVARKKEEVEKLRKEIREREEELKKMKEEAQKTVEVAISKLQSNFHKAYESFESQGGKVIKDLAKGFDDEIHELKKNVEDTAQRTMEASEHISELSQCYSELIQSHVNQSNDSANSAKYYLNNIITINEQIKELNPLVFDPGAYSEIENLIANTVANINAQRYQAALTNAQFGTMKASELLTKLIMSNDAYFKEMAKTIEIANSLKSEFDQFDSSMDGGFEFDIDGTKYEYDFDIDHWSEGRFTALRKQFEALYGQIIDAKSKPIPLEQLASLKKMLIDIESRFVRCRDIAQKEMVGSLKAQETAARLCDSLTDNGWDLREHGFEKSDNRNPYTTIYRDASGNTVSIVVSPGANAEKPDIFIEAFSDDKSRADIVKKNIQNILPNEGLCVEQTQHLNDCHQNTDERTFIDNTIAKTKQLNNQRRTRCFGI